ATRRVFMYEPRCSITAGGRSRNSEWLRSRDNLSRGRSAGRLPPGIDMSAPPSQTNIACALEHAADNRSSETRFKRDSYSLWLSIWPPRLPKDIILKEAKSSFNAR